MKLNAVRKENCEIEDLFMERWMGVCVGVHDASERQEMEDVNVNE